MFTNLLLIANLGLLGGLLWKQLQLRSATQRLSQQLAELPVANLPVAGLTEILGTGRRDLIAIEILNPMELAAKESWFAEKFGSLTPNLIRKIVHEQAIGRTEQIMQQQGAKADVRLHRGA